MPAKTRGGLLLKVLAVATEWTSGHGGLSTFNRELCRALAACGAHVWCLVLSAAREDVAEAARHGVTLVLAETRVGADDWVRLAASRPLPPTEPPDVVVGHGRITGLAAKAIAEGYTSRRVHFLHMAPQDIEWLKVGPNDRGRTIDERLQIETELSRTADVIVAIGPHLAAEFTTSFRGWLAGRLVHVFLPGLVERDSSQSEGLPPYARCLLLGRLEDAALKGLQMGSMAVGKAFRRMQQGSGSDLNLRFLVRGADPGTADELAQQIRTWVGTASVQIDVRPYTSDQTRVKDDIASASLVLMPSREEGFGLVGLEAISAGTPCLLSGRSGLARMLDGLGLAPGLADGSIVPVSGVLSVDAKTWADRIVKVLANRHDAFHRANALRSAMSKAVDWKVQVKHLLDVVAGQSESTVASHRDGPATGRMSNQDEVVERARDLFAEGDYAGARALLEAARDHYRMSPEFVGQYVITLLRHGGIREAQAELDAYRSDGGSETDLVRVRQAEVYWRGDRKKLHERALALLSEVHGQEHQAVVNYQKGRCCLYLFEQDHNPVDIERSDAHLRKAWELRPDFWWVALHWAITNKLRAQAGVPARVARLEMTRRAWDGVHVIESVLSTRPCKGSARLYRLLAFALLDDRRRFDEAAAADRMAFSARLQAADKLQVPPDLLAFVRQRLLRFCNDRAGQFEEFGGALDEWARHDGFRMLAL